VLWRPQYSYTYISSGELKLVLGVHSRHNQHLIWNSVQLFRQFVTLLSNIWFRINTSSSAMADRPCDCLHLQSSLCSCRHCQWFYAGLARHQRCRSYSPGKKDKDWLARLAQHLEQVCARTPCTEHQRMSQSQRFTEEVVHFWWIFDREGGIIHQPVLVSES